MHTFSVRQKFIRCRSVTVGGQLLRSNLIVVFNSQQTAIKYYAPNFYGLRKILGVERSNLMRKLVRLNQNNGETIDDRGVERCLKALMHNRKIDGFLSYELDTYNLNGCVMIYAHWIWVVRNKSSTVHCKSTNSQI